MDVKDYLVTENLNKWFLVKMKSGETLPITVGQDVPYDPICFYDNYGWDCESVGSDEILEVLAEIDAPKQCAVCEIPTVDGELCTPCQEDVDKFAKFSTGQPSVYRYAGKDELKELLEVLGESEGSEPIINNSRFDNDEYIGNLVYDYGLVYYWSEYDDFSCYGDGTTYYVGIIDGAKIEGK